MNQWLDGFAYRTNISIFELIFSAGLMVIIAMAPVFFQPLKAAMTNPVRNLRSE